MQQCKKKQSILLCIVLNTIFQERLLFHLDIQCWDFNVLIFYYMNGKLHHTLRHTLAKNHCINVDLIPVHGHKRHVFEFPHRSFNVYFPPYTLFSKCFADENQCQCALLLEKSVHDFIIKIFMAASTTWICAVNSTLSVKCVLFVLEKPHSKDERNFPPVVYVGNTKISIGLYVETPYLFNIFFWECRLLQWGLDVITTQGYTKYKVMHGTNPLLCIITFFQNRLHFHLGIQCWPYNVLTFYYMNGKLHHTSITVLLGCY